MNDDSSYNKLNDYKTIKTIPYENNMILRVS